MSNDDKELIQEFVIESNEHLANIEDQLLTIEGNRDNIDVDLVNTVFRAIHSIKGAAGFLGLKKINDLSHSLENVLNQMRNRELMPSSAIIDTMLRASDLLSTMLNNIDESEETEIASLVTSLDHIAEQKSTVPTSTEAVIQENIPAESQHAKKVSEEKPAPITAPAVVEPQQAVPADKNQKNSRETNSTEQAVDQNIRVPVSVLDHLMNLAGELVLSRNQILQVIANSKEAGLETISSGLDQVTSELQEAIMQTRMQPIGTVFSRFNRVVRDLGSKLGKICKIEIEGKEVEVDKTIIEAITDPLTHLIRNSMDHGIEDPDTRTANGKTAEGHIELRAFHQAGKVNIEIVDDGAGIDPDKLKSKAVTKGIITTDQAELLSNRDAVRLIFHPGFSTAEKLTDVSGRGVGMDVVRSNIEKLGGSVDVDSTVGVGTKVMVTLPLTLAIIPSLIIQSGGSRFAIPQTNISELVRIRDEDLNQRINQVKGAEMLRLRGSLLPLVRFDQVISHSRDQFKQNQEVSLDSHQTLNEVRNIVVVETGQSRYGLVVEKLHDSEEIVVKPLGRHLAECHCLSGATILGDGHIALILDAPGIAHHAQLDMTDKNEFDADARHEMNSEMEEESSILTFANHPSELFALPMSIVQRVERIHKDEISLVGGQEILQYRGSSLPLLRLENIITAKPLEEGPTRVYVAIFEIRGYEIGLIVPRLEDIQDVAMNVDTITFAETGVIGSLVIQEKAIRLLDVFEMIEKVKPEWFESKKPKPVTNTLQTNLTNFTEQGQESSSTKILLAEDSDFFRSQVKSFLEDAGYEVMEAEDGQIAWNLMISTDQEIHMVVTDIEMPNMNGFELSEKIRASQQFTKLPIIALTSLASEEHRQRGESVGIDDYQIKMDREKLLASVEQYSQIALKNQSNQTETVGVE